MQKAMSKYENALLQAVKANPEDPVALGGMANFLSLDVERADEAVEMFERALLMSAKDPKPSTVHATFSCLFATFLMNSAGAGVGECWVNKAEGLFKRTLELDPRHPMALGDYAVFTHRELKNYKDAEVLYKKALETHPQQASIWSKYANFLKSVKKDLKGAEVRRRMEHGAARSVCSGAACARFIFSSFFAASR